MNTDGGWITVSEAARLYGKSRKWVYDQIKRHQIGTEKTANRTRLRLVRSYRASGRATERCTW